MMDITGATGQAPEAFGDNMTPERTALVAAQVSYDIVGGTSWPTPADVLWLEAVAAGRYGRQYGPGFREVEGGPYHGWPAVQHAVDRALGLVKRFEADHQLKRANATPASFEWADIYGRKINNA